MSTSNKEIYPLLYAGPISYYAHYIHHPGMFDIHENFGKQSFRNRMKIYGANGVITLSIPTKGSSQKQPIDEVQVSNIELWQKNHWKSLVSAYKSSPFFEYYSHLISPLYEEQYRFIKDFNLAFHEVILTCLQLEIPILFSDQFYPIKDKDLRMVYSSKKAHLAANTFSKYQQVFSYQTPFQPDLSILDALFNLGPETESYLHSVYSDMNA